MTKNIILFLALFTPSLGFSQAKVTTGTPYEVVDAKSKSYFSKNGEILTVKVVEDGERVIIQKMNAVTLKIKSAKVYEDFPKRANIEQVVRLRNNYYVIYSDTDGKTELLFAREIDFAKGVFKSAGKKIITEEKGIARVLDPESLNKMKPDDKYTFTYSFDSTLLAIHYPLKTAHLDYRKDPYAIGTHVFDNELKRQWESEAILPYLHGRMRVIDFGLDTGGMLYMMARVDTGDELRDDEFLLFAIGPDGQARPAKINAGHKYPVAARLVGKRDGSMTGVAYCGNKAGRADGLAIFGIKEDGSVADYRTCPIPGTILDLHTSADQKARNVSSADRVFSELKLKHVEMMSDGSIVVVGEQNFIEKRVSMYDGRTSNAYVGHSNDILIAKVDATGKLLWINRLPKRQECYTPDLYGMGHAYVRGSNAHYMYFLDNEKNRDLDMKAIPERHISGLGGFLTAYAVDDATGAPSRLQLLDTRSLNGMEVGQFSPTRILSIAPNTVVFEAYKKKKEDVLIKVTLPDGH